MPYASHPCSNCRRSVWAHQTGLFGPGTIPLPGKDLVRNVFGIERVRILDGSGISVLNLQYQSAELFEVFRHSDKIDLRILVEPEDIGAISVEVPGKGF
jgi:hypothetical protein